VQSSDDFNQVLLRLVSMLELVLLGLVPSTHFGEELHRAELVGEFDLAALRVVGLRQWVIGGYFCDGRFSESPLSIELPDPLIVGTSLYFGHATLRFWPRRSHLPSIDMRSEPA
jgi:hypothetical protein